MLASSELLMPQPGPPRLHRPVRPIPPLDIEAAARAAEALQRRFPHLPPYRLALLVDDAAARLSRYGPVVEREVVEECTRSLARAAS